MNQYDVTKHPWVNCLVEARMIDCMTQKNGCNCFNLDWYVFVKGLYVVEGKHLNHQTRLSLVTSNDVSIELISHI